MFKCSLKRSTAVFVILTMLFTIMPYSFQNVIAANENTGFQTPPASNAVQEPVVPPFGANHDAPPVAMGLGNTFTLFPVDPSGLTGVSNSAIGEYTVADIDTFYNLGFGKVTVHALPGGSLGSTIPDSNAARVYATVDAGTVEFTYTPRTGLLTGVETQVRIFWQPWGTNTIKATVKYNGKTETLDLKKATSDVEIVTIGTYESVESVTLSGNQAIPPVMFKVVNENPGQPAPQLPDLLYHDQNLSTVIPPSMKPELTTNGTSVVSVNEVCAGNTQGLPDWIELYNSSSAEVSLYNYGLTDTESNLGAWRFPADAKIPAKGYLTVYAVGKDAPYGQYNANFSLSKGGEKVILTDQVGAVVSIIDYPAIADDTTIGRYPDGSGYLKIMAETTPGAANKDGNVYLPKPIFSAQGGFYPNPFDLTMSLPAGISGTIRYTTDGSIPTASSPVFPTALNIVRPVEANNLSAKVYKNYKDSPIIPPSYLVDKTRVIRAAIFDGQGNVSETATKTFFVGYNMKNDFNNQAVISISTNQENLIDYPNDTPVPNFGIWTDSNPNDTYLEQFALKNGKEWERPAYVEMFENDGERAFGQNVGIRVRGFSSSTFPQKGLNFYARSEYGESKFAYNIFGDINDLNGKKIKELDSFCIRTGGRRAFNTRSNDAVFMRLANDFGEPGQNGRNATVFINGEYWGIYFLQEKTDEDNISEHYGVPADDIVMKKGSIGDLMTREPGSDTDFYAAARAWLGNNNMSIDTNYKKLDAEYDIDNMMRYYALNIIAGNGDWGTYNYVMWRSRSVTDKPYQDGKWRFLINDLDETTRSIGEDVTKAALLGHEAGKAIMSSPSLKCKFFNTYFDCLSTAYDPVKLFEEASRWYYEMRPLFPANDKRWGYPYIKYGLENRYAQLITMEPYRIAALRKSGTEGPGATGYYTNFNVKISDDANGESGKVKINSQVHDFTKGNYSGNYLTDYTQTLTAIPNEGYRFVCWEASEGTGLSSTVDDTVYVSLAKNGSEVKAVFEVDDPNYTPTPKPSPSPIPSIKPSPLPTPTPSLIPSPSPIPSANPTSGTNVALQATAAVSSSYSGSLASAINDGVVSGYPANATKEWASNVQKVGAWAQLTWTTAQTINKIRLYDRPNGNDQATSGTLTFSDGSSISVGALPNDAATPSEITFENKTVTWVRFTVDSVSASTYAVGLAEFEVYEGVTDLYDDFSTWEGTPDSSIFTKTKAYSYSSNVRFKIANYKTYFGSFAKCLEGSSGEDVDLTYTGNFDGKMAIIGLSLDNVLGGSDAFKTAYSALDNRVDLISAWDYLYEYYKDRLEIYVGDSPSQITTRVTPTHIIGGRPEDGGQPSVGIIVENLPVNTKFIMLVLKQAKWEDNFSYVSIKSDKTILENALPLNETLAISAINRSADAGVQSITVRGEATEGLLMVGVYQEDRLIGIKMASITQDDFVGNMATVLTPIAAIPTGAKIKAFFVDSANNISPLTKAK